MQKCLDNDNYLMGGLVVPHIFELRDGLKKALVDLKKTAPADSRDEVISCVKVLVKSINDGWRSGND